MPPAQTETCLDETARPRVILLVDDDRDFLLIHEKILVKAGYHVLTAATGEEGLDMARRYCPDVVLHDIDLPDGIGLDFGRRIKGDPVCGPARLLFISGIKIAPEDKAAGLRAGADGYLFKPIHKEELLAQIEAVLRVSQAKSKLLRQAEVNRSLAEIAKTLTLPNTGLADMAEVVLDQARRLTGSEEGFVSSIEPVTMDNVVHTFSTMMGGNDCQVRDKRIAFPRGEDGYPCLWGHCLNTRKGFYTNTPAAHSSSTGLPEGHLPLRRFLSVPALYQNQIYGQIALANADRDYTDEDLIMLESMAHLFAVSVSRKFSMDALRKSEEQYRMIVETANEGIRVQDTEGRVTFLNKRMADILGKRPEDLLGTSVLDTIHPDERQDYAQRIKRRRMGISEEYERRHMHADGSTIWTKISATPIYDDQGRNIGSFAMISDITERKKAEEQLRKLSRAVEQSPVSIVLTDLRGTIEYVNPAFTNATGYAFDEVIGKNPRVLKSPDRKPEDYKEMWETLTSGREWRGEFKNIKKNGEAYWESASISPISDEQGRITHYVAVKEDITVRKKVEAQLDQYAKQMELKNQELDAALVRAEAATRAKSEFLANMSHEIRTPMNGVIGMTGLLLDTDLTEEQRRFTETIQSSGEALLNLINDILDYSKIEAGRLEIETVDFDLQSLMDDFAATLALRAHEKGLEFISFIDPDVPRLLRGDPGRLRQILTNLVGNAVKFTERGEVVVRVEEAKVHGSRFNGSTVGGPADGDDAGATRGHPSADAQYPTVNREPLNLESLTVKLRFTVRDTGIGIPEDKTDILFDKFSQVDASITRKFGGTGLGLAISRELAEMMGGEIGVVSTPGQGSEFWFTARFIVQEAVPDMTYAQSRDLNGLHVLVVDDNDTNMDILLRQFAGWGMRPQGVSGGERALEAAAAAHERNEQFDLAIIDYQMPGMDGGELGKRFKADTRFQSIPLVMLTSLGRPGDARVCAELGFAAYLNKPVRGSELYDTLALVMADTGLRTPSSPIITRHMAREIQRRKATLPRFSGRILVAEDNLVNQQVALGMLKNFGLRADAVVNGLEALHALQALPYDLVLMDVMMPEMDGLVATRRIRAAEDERRKEEEVRVQKSEVRGQISSPVPSTFNLQPPTSHLRLPVIAMTAGAMREDRERCFEAGMDDYLPKPVTPNELVRVLGKWLPVEEDGGRKTVDRGRKREDGRSGEDRNAGKKTNGDQQPPAKDGLPVIDRASLLRRLMGDENLLQDVLKMFLETMPQRIQELRAALDAEDAHAARLATHSIKGMAGNVSAEALRSLAGKMENAAQEGNLNVLRGWLGELADTFEDFRKVAMEAEKNAL